jgi:hypothetical protein
MTFERLKLLNTRYLALVGKTANSHVQNRDQFPPRLSFFSSHFPVFLSFFHFFPSFSLFFFFSFSFFSPLFPYRKANEFGRSLQDLTPPPLFTFVRLSSKSFWSPFANEINERSLTKKGNFFRVTTSWNSMCGVCVGMFVGVCVGGRFLWQSVTIFENKRGSKAWRRWFNLEMTFADTLSPPTLWWLAMVGVGDWWWSVHGWQW